jgi:hypothetical protein
MSHPNIIKVTDLIDDNDTVAFVMEKQFITELKDLCPSEFQIIV